jgi:hypothetical protein
MFERFRRSSGNGDDDRERGGVATVERDRARDGGDGAVRTHDRSGQTAVQPSPRERRLRAREDFGGVNWGAAFFGWLVAVGMSVILLALVSAAGAAIGLTGVSADEAESQAETLSLVGGILFVAILLVAYFAGGYVAGRMSRFDGGRQGAAVWFLGLLVTIALAVAGAIGGSEYNVLEQLNLPRIPVDEGSLATGGAVALGLIVLGTLLAAVLGGKSGRRYHDRVDRVAWPADG